MSKRKQHEWRKPSECEQQGSMHYTGNGTDIQEHERPLGPEYSKTLIAQVSSCGTSNLLLSEIVKALFYHKTQDMPKLQAQSDKHQKHALQATAGNINRILATIIYNTAPYMRAQFLRMRIKTVQPFKNW